MFQNIFNDIYLDIHLISLKKYTYAKDVNQFIEEMFAG